MILYISIFIYEKMKKDELQLYDKKLTASSETKLYYMHARHRYQRSGFPFSRE